MDGIESHADSSVSASVKRAMRVHIFILSRDPWLGYETTAIASFIRCPSLSFCLSFVFLFSVPAHFFCPTRQPHLEVPVVRDGAEGAIKCDARSVALPHAKLDPAGERVDTHERAHERLAVAALTMGRIDKEVLEKEIPLARPGAKGARVNRRAADRRLSVLSSSRKFIK